MNKKDIEIEIQVKIERSKKLLEFLKKNAKFVEESRQVDKYLTPLHRNFTNVRPIAEWLRLRDSSGKYSITYKNWYKQDGEAICDEYETEITNFDQLNKILNVLNFKQIIIVDKIRKIWQYNDYEIAMDSVKDLGDFVEVEYKGNLGKKSPANIIREMRQFLKDLDCGKLISGNGGYAFMLLAPDEIKYEIC